MAKSPLTNTQIKQVKPTEKILTLSDGGGLQFKVTPSGSKLWQLRYKNPFTKRYTLMGLGKYPDVSLADARKARQSAKELLAKGINPIDQRNAKALAVLEEHTNTFKVIADKWFEVKKASISESYAKDIWGSLTRHIFPHIGGYPISQLTAPKVIQVLNPLVADGKYDTIKRICQRINEIMVFSINTGIIRHNDLSGIGKAFISQKVVNNTNLEN